jgi:hypothetical protein
LVRINIVPIGFKAAARLARDVPSGRLLYRTLDRARYVAVTSRTSGLWIVEEGWTAESRAAGPFRPNDALRAVRLANVAVPEGCELGPWQEGIGLFVREPLPGHPNDWSRVDAAWLPPSVSRYAGTDMERVINESCCARPSDPPRIDWHAQSTDEERAARELVAIRCPDLDLGAFGLLARAWNIHPSGSPALTETASSSGNVVIVDLPPTP